MKLFSKNLNIAISLFAVFSVISCGVQEDIVYTSNQNIPEIQNVTEAFVSNVSESTAEQILKKDEEKQVAKETKEQEVAIASASGSSINKNVSSKDPNISSNGETSQVSASSIFKKQTNPYIGQPLPAGTKQYTLSLQKDPAFINKIMFEPSALCFDDKGSLYTVADKLHHSLYKFDLSNSSKGYNLSEDIKPKSSQMLKLRLKKKNKFDFEGLEFFNGNFYVADERDRKVLKIDRSGNITDLKIDSNGYMKSKGIRNNVENSGFEGLTIDPVNEIMYLIKERQESMVLVVDMKTNTIINNFKILTPGSVEPTLTDASFYNGYLYVLIRSHRQIVKVNPSNGSILSVFDYRKIEEDPKYVYKKIPDLEAGNDPDGYGVMEGLAVTEKSMYVVTDNNMLPLKRNLLNNKPQLFIFNNPESTL